MQWAKEIPTEDGYYWIRSKYRTWLEEIKDSCTYSYGAYKWNRIFKKITLNSTDH